MPALWWLSLELMEYQSHGKFQTMLGYLQYHVGSHRPNSQFATTRRSFESKEPGRKKRLAIVSCVFNGQGLSEAGSLRSF
jgi:hypothetical protein